MYPPADILYTNELLRAMRLEMDPVADAVVQELFTAGKADIVNELLTTAPKNAQPPPANLPVRVRDYFSETAQLPPWADRRRMIAGAAFFAKHIQPILSTLGSLSLPYCYAAADGAQVLYLSQRIRSNPRKRLTDTAQFVISVMDRHAFDQQGTGIRAIQKVRLMHAAIRYHIQQSNQWNDAWGMPVNQEDMAGTNLSLSYIVLEGLHKLGIYYSSQEAEDYLHLWNVIGFLLGVRPVLLPANQKNAFWLDKRIAERHFRQSEAGVALTKSLLRCFGELNPAGASLMPAYMRFLLGNKVADLLAVPKAELSQLLIKPIKAANTLRSVVSGFSQNELSAHASDALLKAIRLETGEAEFHIPTTLTGAAH